MHTQTIIAADSRSALERVTELLGPDAVVISTRKTSRGVEITAGVQPSMGFATPPRRMPEPVRPAAMAGDPMVRFIDQAKAMGIDPEVLKLELAMGGNDLGDVWSRFLIRIEREIAIAPPPTRGLNHLCVVGDSGSAKTTTLAQLAAQARREQPEEPIALLSGDRRPGAREQLHVIARMLRLPCLEPDAGEPLSEAVRRLGGSRRLFVDMPSDPRLAVQEVEALRSRLGGGVDTLCTLPLTGQLARHRQVAALFANDFDGYVITHAGEILPPGAVITMLLETGRPLTSVGRSADFGAGLGAARNTSLCRMAVAALSAGSLQ